MLTERLHPRLARRLCVKKDPQTRQLYYDLYGKRVYIQQPRDFRHHKSVAWQCEQLYFKHYLPRPKDVVVDFGAGFGEEIVWLHTHHSRQWPGRYIAVEPQPSVFACLGLTVARLSPNYETCPWVISDDQFVFFNVGPHYISSGLAPDGQLRLPGMSWSHFIQKYDLQHNEIDLLKVNIEGAEFALLQSIGTDIERIERVIISCHDFLGPLFRTKDRVMNHLLTHGFELREFNTGRPGADDWIYGERQ